MCFKLCQDSGYADHDDVDDHGEWDGDSGGGGMAW